MTKLFVLLFATLVWLSAPLAEAATSVSSSPTASVPGKSADATAVIKLFYAQLLDTMKLGNKLGFEGRYKKLAPTIKSAFNLPFMTRVSVGLVWAQATPQEQQSLISAFSDFSVATYANRFTDFEGESFNIIGQTPTTSGMMVETTITPVDRDPVRINYLMRVDDKGSYRIVDVFLNGSISELATRRAEFNAIVQRDGISALVNTLGEKSKQMGPS